MKQFESTFVAPPRMFGVCESILACLFFSFFSTSSNPLLSYVGYGFMAILYGLATISFFRELAKGIPRKRFLTDVLFLGVLLVFLLNSDFSSSSLVSLVQLVCVYLWIRYSRLLDFPSINLLRLSWTNAFLMVVFYLLAFMRLYLNMDFMFHNYASIAPLALGLVVINFTFYKVFPEYKSFHYWGYLPLLVLCRSRNAMTCILLFFFYVRFITTKSRQAMLLTFGVLGSFIYLISVQYPLLYRTDLGDRLNELSFQYTQKSFFSGRQLIWRNILDSMGGHEWLGYGTGVVYGNLFNDERSAHNQYLQVYLQNGLVGLGFLWIALLFIWNGIYKNKLMTMEGMGNHYLCKIAEGFFVVMVLYNTFSVAMLQNSMVTANLFWFIVSFGLNHSLDENRKWLSHTHPRTGNIL